MGFLSLDELLTLRTVSRNFNIGVYQHLMERIPEEEQTVENTIVLTILIMYLIFIVCESTYSKNIETDLLISISKY